MTAIFVDLFGLLFAILASGVGIGLLLAITAMLLAAFFSDTSYGQKIKSSRPSVSV